MPEPKFKPNRPIRVGTEMKMTDKDGNVPGRRVNKTGSASSDALPDVNERMGRDDLIAIADGEKVAYETDDNKADIVKKIQANRKGNK